MSSRAGRGKSNGEPSVSYLSSTFSIRKTDQPDHLMSFPAFQDLSHNIYKKPKHSRKSLMDSSVLKEKLGFPFHQERKKLSCGSNWGGLGMRNQRAILLCGNSSKLQKKCAAWRWLKVPSICVVLHRCKMPVSRGSDAKAEKTKHWLACYLPGKCIFSVRIRMHAIRGDIYRKPFSHAIFYF